MSSKLEAEAPTFHSLNKAQKRALILRDQLRWADIHHLDTFISGILEPEPPIYKRINGTVVPPLILVTLHPAAARYDLGNVQFDTPSEQGPAGIYHAYLTVEDGSFELRTEDALPADEGNLETVPIHIFIASTMLAMFETKFKAIWARKNQINEIRKVAFDVASKVPEPDQFRAGQTLSRLDYDRTGQNGSSFQSRKAKKLRPGEPVPKHPSNKRKHVGLDTIPQDAKTATFNAIPARIKVDFFNNVIKTAFPNFDNLMMASWNVVSIYSNVGTDFPELHKSITQLKSVLQDFEDSFGHRPKSDEPRIKRDLALPNQEHKDADNENENENENENDMSAQHALTPTHTQQNDNKDPPASTSSHDNPKHLDDAEIDSLFVDPGPDPEPQHNMPPPPRILQTTQPSPSSSSTTANEPTLPPPRPQPRHSTPDFKFPTSTPTSTRSSPSPLPPAKRKRVQSLEPRIQSRASPLPSSSSSSSTTTTTTSTPPPKSFSQMTTTELRQTYKTRKAQLLQTFSALANVPQQYRVQMQELMRECKAREAAEREAGLGNSVLGGRAPVAMMVRRRRGDGDGDGEEEE